MAAHLLRQQSRPEQVSIESGPLDDCLHQLDIVSRQSDDGAYTLERIYQFLGNMIKIQQNFANQIEKACKDEGKFQRQNKDGIAHAAGIYNGVVSYYAKTAKTQLLLSKQLHANLRPPIYEAIQDINRIHDAAEMKEAKYNGEMEAHRQKYEAQREKSMHYWDKLRGAIDAVDKKAQKHGARSEKTSKARGYFKKQVDKAAKSFKESEDLYDASNKARRKIYKTGMLEVVRHHQASEKRRLGKLREFAVGWVEASKVLHCAQDRLLFPIDTYIDDLKDPYVPIAKLKAKWHKKTPPVPLPDIRLGLPTSSKVISDNQASLGRMLHETDLKQLMRAHDREVHPPPAKLLRTPSGRRPASTTKAKMSKQRSKRTMHDLSRGSLVAPKTARPEASKEGEKSEKEKSDTDLEDLKMSTKRIGITWDQQKRAAKEDKPMSTDLTLLAPSILANIFKDLDSDQPEEKEESYEYAIALYDFTNPDANCVNFRKGDLIIIMSKDPSGWWRGCAAQGSSWTAEGAFPGNYVQPSR